MQRALQRRIETPGFELRLLKRNLFALFGIMLFIVVLAGCSNSKKEVASQPAATTESQPAAERTPKYTVQELPGGTVRGQVVLQGNPPPAQKVAVNQDPAVCGSQRETHPVQIEKGGIVDTVVSIEDIKHGKAFAFPAPLLEQKHCTYVPHIVLMQPGELRIESSDPVPHNVHTYAQNNREYNETMNQLRRTISLSFPRPDRISVRCDLHGWMQAFVIVAENPYYSVTTAGGNFTLEGVPAGHYRLKVWHPTLGEAEQQIDVEAGKVTNARFSLATKSAPAGGGD